MGSLALACIPKGHTLHTQGLHYRVNYEIFKVLNAQKCENINDFLKVFFLSCRRSAVTQHLSEAHKYRDIIKMLPRKDQWQYSAGHKALCTSSDFDIKTIKAEWKKIFVPEQKEFNKMQNSSKITTQEVWVHRNKDLPLPSNKKWIKRGGCFDVASGHGGALAGLRKFFRQSDLNALMSKGLTKQMQQLPALFREISSNCEKHLRHNFSNQCPIGTRNEKGDYIMECDSECSHPFLYEMVVLNSPQGKVRMATMFMVALLYLQSILQKLVTAAMKNLLVAQEGLQSRPDFVGPIRASLVYKTDKPFLFHSGDLTNCTNNYSYFTSRALCRNLLRSFKVDMRHYDWLIDMTFGPYRIIQNSSDAEELRHPTIPHYLSLLEYSVYNTWFTTRMGQHLSSPLSFPNMAMMHAQAYAQLNAKDSETYHVKKFSEQFMSQTYTRLCKMEKGSFFYLVTGITDKGFLAKYRKDELLQTMGYIAWCLNELKVQWKLIMPDWRKDPYARWVRTIHWNNFQLFPEEITGCEYKGNLSRRYIMNMARYYPVKWNSEWDCFWAAKSKFPTPIFQIFSNLEPIKFNYMSTFDLRALKDFNNDERYESMTHRIHPDKKNVIALHRKSYLMTVGDDHLHWTKESHYINRYKSILKNEYNQSYNDKADFISQTGAVIAEHCIQINQSKNKVTEICFLRPKQLLQEEPDEVSWIDKLRSILPTFKLLYYGRNTRTRSEKYKKAFRAQEIFILNHQKVFNYYCKKTVSPYLPYYLGGLDVNGYLELNEITRKHLRNLNFLVVYSQELLYWYQKRIAKARMSSKVKLSHPHKSFIQSNAGKIAFPKKEAKRIIYGIGGVASGLASAVIDNKKKTLKEIIDSYNSLIISMYDYIKYQLNEDKSEINKSFHKDEFVILNIRCEQSTGPHFEDDLLYAEFPQCEENLEIVSSKVNAVKKVFKSHFDLGEKVQGWQPVSHIYPANPDPFINLENLCFLKYLPQKPIEDPGNYYINHAAAAELSLIGSLDPEETKKIDRARFLNELTTVNFVKAV